MPRGVRVSNRIREKALALIVTEGNVSSVGRMMNIANQTLSDWSREEDKFGSFREEIEKAYIVEAWGNVAEASRLMKLKLADPEFTDKLSIRALSEVLVNLHNTVSNVATHMLAVQVNVNVATDKAEDIELATLTYMADKYNLSTDEVISRLTR